MAPRVPPQSIDAERQVLGSMLIDSRQEAAAVAVEILTAAHFYRTSHQKIFTAIISLFERAEPIDLVTVSEELRRRTWLEDAGGISYLTELVRDTVAGIDIEYHARLVYEKNLLRQLITICEEGRERCYRDTEEVEKLVDDLESKIFSVTEHAARRSFIIARDLVKPVMDAITELARRKNLVTGIPTGYIQLDEMTSGFQPANLIILAARPSMGKTALGLNIAQNAALQHNIGVGIFSLEMTNEELFKRMLCSQAHLDAHKMQTGRLSREEWKHLMRASSVLMNAPIYMDDSSSLTIMEIRARARRLISRDSNVRMIIIDHMQLMQSHTRKENRQQEITEISRLLKALAKDLNVPVVAVSQLSRAVESRTERRPQLSDLRESGAIEQDADMVLFIHRPGYYKKRESSESDMVDDAEAEIIIAKQRNGPVGTLNLHFLSHCMRFENPYLGESDVVPLEDRTEAAVFEDSGADFA